MLLEQGKDRQAHETGKALPDALGSPCLIFTSALLRSIPASLVAECLRWSVICCSFPTTGRRNFSSPGAIPFWAKTSAHETSSSLPSAEHGVELDDIYQFHDAIRARESRFKQDH